MAEILLPGVGQPRLFATSLASRPNKQGLRFPRYNVPRELARSWGLLPGAADARIYVATTPNERVPDSQNFFRLGATLFEEDQRSFKLASNYLIEVPKAGLHPNTPEKLAMTAMVWGGRATAYVVPTEELHIRFGEAQNNGQAGAMPLNTEALGALVLHGLGRTPNTGLPSSVVPAVVETVQPPQIIRLFPEFFPAVAELAGL